MCDEDVREVQNEEILALQSIYSEEEYLKLNAYSSVDNNGMQSFEQDAIDFHSLISGDFSAHIKLESDFTIKGMTLSLSFLVGSNHN